MKALADYVHGKGLQFGLNTSVGNLTCKGDRPGSYGHYEDDAQTLAGWGVDMVPVFCKLIPVDEMRVAGERRSLGVGLILLAPACVRGD